MENKDKPGSKALRGRPKKETTFDGVKRSQKEKLSCSINLKLSEKDFKSVKQKAEKLGMKATRYAREMVLKGSVKLRFSLEELELMRKLSGMANNLNQIARQANKSGFSVSAMEIIKISKQIKELFNDR
jgi:hypothetical protein